MLFRRRRQVILFRAKEMVDLNVAPLISAAENAIFFQLVDHDVLHPARRGLEQLVRHDVEGIPLDVLLDPHPAALRRGTDHLVLDEAHAREALQLLLLRARVAGDEAPLAQHPLVRLLARHHEEDAARRATGVNEFVDPLPRGPNGDALKTVAHSRDLVFRDNECLISLNDMCDKEQGASPLKLRKRLVQWRHR